MSVELDNRPGTPDADKNDPGQQHYDNVFNRLTSDEHLAKSAPDPQAADANERSFFNANKDASSKVAGLPGGAAGNSGGINPINAAGGLFNGVADGPGFMSRLLKGRRKGVTGGIIGLFVTGGIFLGLGVSSGPLQFIHLAQLLEQFHSQEQNDEADDRMSRLTRAYRYAKTGKVEETRLGYFGRHYAPGIEAKLNESGLKSTYNGIGDFQGYEVDKTNDNFKGKTNDQIKAQLKEDYGVNVNIDESTGRPIVTPESNGYFAQRRMIGAIVKQAGFKGIPGFLQARIAAKKAGLKLSPIARLDAKLRTAAYNKFKDATTKQISDEVENGTTAEAAKTGTAEDENNKDQNGNPQTDPAATSASDEANGTIDDASKAAAGGADETKIKASLKAKLAGGGAALIGVACTIKALDDGADKVKEAQTVLPLMRLGATFVSLGSQAQYGGADNPDFNKQLGAVSQQYFTSDEQGNTGSWSDAQSIQAELGQKQTGVAPDSVLQNINKGSPLAFINQGVLGTFTSAACGTVGKIALGVFSFVTGPISFAVGYAAGEALSASGVIDDVVNALAGKSVNLATLAGPQFGNYVNFGYKMFSDQQFVSAGGTMMSPAAHAQIDAQQEKEATEDFESHGFAYRVFSPDTSRSLVGSMIDAENPAISANITQAAGSFTHFGSTLLSIPTKLFGASAHAAAGDYQYGDLPNYGFTEAELNDPNVADPYKNADYVVSNLLTNPSVISAANTCFGVNISSDGSSFQAAGDNITDIYKHGDGGYDSSGCADGSKAGVSREDWVRVRFFIFDSETADSMSCFEGDDTSCTDIGASNSNPSETATTSTGSTVSGDAPALAKQVLANPKISLGPTAKADLVATENNQQVTPGAIAGGGAGTTPCSARTPTYLNATLLQAMLNIATKYNYEIQDITSGHNCDSGRHPLGRAFDIFQVNGKPMTWSGSNLADDKQFATDVTTIMSQLLPNGKFVNSRPVNMAGIGVCSNDDVANPPNNVNYFEDACDELHVDVGLAP